MDVELLIIKPEILICIAPRFGLWVCSRQWVNVRIETIDWKYPFKQLLQKSKEQPQHLEGKYVVREPRDLRSKFQLMMEQREKDKVEAEYQRLAEEERLRIEVSLL